MTAVHDARVSGRITFVIPTRNNERTIAACVASAHNQTGDVEVLVVDNHSSDATAELARSHGADRVLIGGPERSAQRNLGFGISTGEVVVFIDSDMVVEDGVACHLRTLFADPDLGAAVLPETSFGVGYLAQCRALEKRLYLGRASAEAARAFRASAFEAVSGYDEDNCGFEDYELADRVRDAGWPSDRTPRGVRHDEGRVNLRSLWHKKRYYGSNWPSYAATRSGHGRLRRFPLRPGLLAADAPHVPGLVLLKLVDLSGLVVGRLWSPHPRRRGNATPTPWRRGLALGLIRAVRRLLRGTFVQRLCITTWCYRRVARVAAGSHRNLQVTFRGLDLLAPAADITITPTLATGDYERTAIDAFFRLLPRGGTVLDVGANIGVHSLLAAKAVGPQGTVVAFEPIRENRELASLNAARNCIANIRMIDKAVGNTEGQLTLYRSRADCGTHSAGLSSGTPERVEVVRLEDWVFREGLNSIDALKIDVEGFDGFVLDGALQLVSAWRPVILIEYVPRQLAACGDDPDRVARMLLRLPGTCFAVDERRRHLVAVTTVNELASALGPAGGNVIVTSATEFLTDLIHPA